MRNFISNPITYLLRGNHHIIIPNMYRTRYILDYIKVELNYHYTIVLFHCHMYHCTIVPLFTLLLFIIPLYHCLLYCCLLYCCLSYHCLLYCCLSYHYTIVYFTVVYHTIIPLFTLLLLLFIIPLFIIPLFHCSILSYHCSIVLLQILIFQYSFWLALFILFVTAATRLSLFGLLYLLLCFIFLYRGQNLLTDPRRTRIKW